MLQKVVAVDDNEIRFENGARLYSYHESDCCENHYLDFSDLNILDFQGLEFDLSSDSFFERVPDYGIRLIPVNGHPVGVPGYGYNNGYYSSHLDLVLDTGDGRIKFDITECQEYKGDY